MIWPGLGWRGFALLAPAATIIPVFAWREPERNRMKFELNETTI